MRETKLEAGMRLACFDCGESWARIIRLPDRRIVRACEKCLKSTSESWLIGQFANESGIVTRSGLIVPYQMIAPHRERAWINHGQHLEEIALRGGWSDWEIILTLDDEPISRTSQAEAETEGRQQAAIVLRDRINNFKSATEGGEG